MTAAKQAQIEAQEVRNWVTGSFLTEDPSVARSAFGPNRVIAFMYKGEPPEKQLITKKEQEDQIKQTRVIKNLIIVSFLSAFFNIRFNFKNLS